jgi:hypothetical protein
MAMKVAEVQKAVKEAVFSQVMALFAEQGEQFGDFASDGVEFDDNIGICSLFAGDESRAILEDVAIETAAKSLVGAYSDDEDIVHVAFGGVDIVVVLRQIFGKFCQNLLHLVFIRHNLRYKILRLSEFGSRHHLHRRGYLPR